MFDLKVDTKKEWLDAVLNDFDSFLLDHASCERKASSTNMSFVVKYPDRQKIMPAIIEMALEELEHFQQVYNIIEKRGLTLTPDVKDEYVNMLLKHVRGGREERFMDRLILSGIIEARGCERLQMVANALTDPELKNFYNDLVKCEAKHRSQFLKLASYYFPQKEVDERLEELLVLEAEALNAIPIRPLVH